MTFQRGRRSPSDAGSEGEVCPSGYLIDGLVGDSLEIGLTEPPANCRCRTRLGAGDSSPPSDAKVRFHDLRHSYAAMLIAEGAHPEP
jgi:integrase